MLSFSPITRFAPTPASAGRRIPVKMLKSTERFAIKTTFASWQYVSPRDIAKRHVPHEDFLEDTVATCQNDEYRRHFSRMFRKPEIVEEAAFLRWVLDMATAEHNAERLDMDEQARIAKKYLDDNSRDWWRF